MRGLLSISMKDSTRQTGFAESEAQRSQGRQIPPWREKDAILESPQHVWAGHEALPAPFPPPTASGGNVSEQTGRGSRSDAVKPQKAAGVSRKEFEVCHEELRASFSVPSQQLSASVWNWTPRPVV